MNCKFSIVPLLEELPIHDYEELVVNTINILSKSIKTNCLNKPKEIQEIEGDLARYKPKFYPGGQSAVFGLKFELPKGLFPLIIKAYTKLNPTQLAYHAVTSKLFLEEFCGGINAKGKKYLVVPVKNVLLSYCEDLQAVFIIQNFSKGKIIDRTVPITAITKIVATKGFIVDPYPNNWRLISTLNINEPKIEYIDTMFSNKLFNNPAVKELIAELKNLQYRCEIE
ncbi:MAG: hypothetical protein ACFFCZ_24420 [Promethearchaeota archaeon]